MLNAVAFCHSVCTLYTHLFRNEFIVLAALQFPLIASQLIHLFRFNENCSLSFRILLYFILCLIIFHSVSVVFMFIFRLLLIISIVSSIIDRIIIVTQRNEKTFHLAIDSLLCRFQSTKIPLLCCAVCTYLYRFSIYSDAQFYRHFPCSILSVHNFC